MEVDLCALFHFPHEFAMHLLIVIAHVIAPFSAVSVSAMNTFTAHTNRLLKALQQCSLRCISLSVRFTLIHLVKRAINVTNLKG